MKNCRFLYSLLTFLFFGCAAAPVPAGSFSIVSWNVETFFDGNRDGIEYSEFKKSDTWGTEAYQVRLKRLCSAIEAMNADIFVMEELENSGIIYDISNQLAGNSWNSRKMYGYGAFSKNAGDAIGCGVISRLPVTALKIHNLDVRTESGSQPAMRPVMEITLAAEKPVTLFVNHWKSKSGGEEESEVWRNWQEEMLAGLFLEHEGEAVIACGDFNRDISEFETVDFGGETLLVQKSNLRLRQNQKAAGSCEVYSPWIKGNSELVKPGSYRFNGTWERIDHFFLKNVTAGEFAPVTDGEWCDENGIPKGYRISSGSGYSDHLPIKCRIYLSY